MSLCRTVPHCVGWDFSCFVGKLATDSDGLIPEDGSAPQNKTKHFCSFFHFCIFFPRIFYTLLRRTVSQTQGEPQRCNCVSVLHGVLVQPVVGTMTLPSALWVGLCPRSQKSVHTGPWGIHAVLGGWTRGPGNFILEGNAPQTPAELELRSRQVFLGAQLHALAMLLPCSEDKTPHGTVFSSSLPDQFPVGTSPSPDGGSQHNMNTVLEKPLGFAVP